MMAFKNSPLNHSSLDLEIEAISRFRSLVPSLKRECRVFRELYGGHSTLLCFDFAACPQKLKMSKQHWLEFCELLLSASNYLGLADSLVFYLGERIVGWISLNQIGK